VGPLGRGERVDLVNALSSWLVQRHRSGILRSPPSPETEPAGVCVRSDAKQESTKRFLRSGRGARSSVVGKIIKRAARGDKTHGC